MKRTNIFCIISVFFLFLSIPLVNAGGLGMGPVKIDMEGIRGRNYQRLLTIYSTFEDKVKLSLTAEGDCADWVSFYDIEDKENSIDEIELFPNSNKKIYARFSVPENVPSKTYTCTLYAKQSENQEKNTQSFSLRVKSKINFDVVGDQRLSGKVRTINIMNIEKNRPLQIEVKFENTGNVVAKPYFDIKIMKEGSEVDMFGYQKGEVGPGKTGTIIIERESLGWPVGNYNAVMDVELDEETVYSRDSLIFEVLETGSITAKGKIKNISYDEAIELDETSKITVQFSNVGEIGFEAKLTGEVYKDNKLVDVLESEEVF
ncbi:MAG: hypothetical protein ABEK17_01020, partial [Candidatus Aenigmatarchaeota archaeon]